MELLTSYFAGFLIGCLFMWFVMRTPIGKDIPTTPSRIYPREFMAGTVSFFGRNVGTEEHECEILEYIEAQGRAKVRDVEKRYPASWVKCAPEAYQRARVSTAKRFGVSIEQVY